MFNFVFMNDFALVLIFVLLISTLWYFWFVYKPYAELPQCRLEHRVPYWILKQVPLNYGEAIYEAQGVFAAWFGAPDLIVYGEEIVKKIVTEPTATDKPKSYHLFEYAIGKGILTSNGERFKKQWKMAAPAFHVTALKSYTTIMNKHSEEMIERLSGLDGHPTEEIIDILSLCAIGTTMELSVGEKEKNIEEYLHIMKVLHITTDFMVKRIWSPWLYFDFALQLFPSARKAHKLITNLLKETLKPKLENIKESRKSRQASPQYSVSDLELTDRRLKPFGESFVEQHLEDSAITMDEVTLQLSFLLAAGFDTVVHTMRYALILLGQHIDVQERAFEEVMSETEGYVTYDDQQRLTYLECVIKETLRLYPVPLFGRYLRKDLQCGQYKLPQNSTVWVLSYMIHRNPEIYPDPEKFDPERFMDKNSKITPWNYIPFAEGLRSCIGKKYAMIQMKIILSHILRNFKIISLDQVEEVDLSWSIILDSTKKLRIQFLPRKPKADY